MNKTFPTRSRTIPRSIGLAIALAATNAVWAAGGHHALDDAVILEPDTCQVETWLARSHGGERRLHAGPGCRVGPVEVGVAAEYARQDGTSETGYAAQVKWAREWMPGFSAGLSVSGGWQAHVRPRYQATTVLALATWVPREDVALHLNLGRDFLRGALNQKRSGVSVEWTPRESWSVTAERYIEEQTHFARAGVRCTINDAWTADLSRAHRLHGPGESNWTFGITRLFSH